METPGGRGRGCEPRVEEQSCSGLLLRASQLPSRPRASSGAPQSPVGVSVRVLGRRGANAALGAPRWHCALCLRTFSEASGTELGRRGVLRRSRGRELISSHRTT